MVCRRNVIFVAAVTLLLAAAMAGCGPTPAPGSSGGQTAAVAPSPAADQPPLAGSAWVLSSLRGEPALETTEITLEFDAETVGGSAGCNSYGGGSNSDPYVATPGGELALPELAMTLMACADAAVMAQETAYIDTLAMVEGYAVEGDTLELKDAGGETVLTYTRRVEGTQGAEALAGTSWVLTALRGDPPVSDTRITLEFEEEIATGFGGCNGYGGGANGDPYVATAGGELALPQMARTAMLCTEPPGVMEQEDAYFDTLATVDGYTIEGDTLALQSAGETVLTFERQPESVGDPAALAGTAWHMVTMDGVAPGDDEVWTIAFHDDGETASGFAGCRGYVAGYSAGQGEIHIGFYLAMMGPVCEEEVLLQREGEYTTMLGWVDRLVLAEGRLELHTVRGETLVYEPLADEARPEIEGTEWTLLAFVESNMGGELSMPADPLAGTEITATFDGGQIGGTAGCNSYGGSYTLDGASLAVSDLFQTEMACMEPDGVMEQESRYLSSLGAAQEARVHGSLLWIDTGSAVSLVFMPSGRAAVN